MRIFYHNVCRDPSSVLVQHENVNISLVLQHFFHVTQTVPDGSTGALFSAPRGRCEICMGITDVFCVPCQARRVRGSLAAGDDGEVIRHAWGTRSNATAATATFSEGQVENARSRRPGSAPQRESQTDATPNGPPAGSGRGAGKERAGATL